MWDDLQDTTYTIRSVAYLTICHAQELRPAVTRQMIPITSVDTGRMWKQWSAAMGVHLVLGIPGVVPVWLLWYLAVNWPLAAMGRTTQEPTENDGVLPWLMVAVPVLALFALVWWLADRSVRRSTALPARLYRPVSVLVTLVPSFVLMAVL
ncbi:hypothetical protein [Streptomyces sclerotialus]|uniref:hypothetical protein n=1 Tax=Streptomyces sclerotialus TaxID=1957 RepID=UPI0034A185B1